MKTYFEMLQEAERLLQQQKIEDAPSDAWYLMEYVTGMNRTGYLLHRQEEMPQEQQEKYQMLIRQRAAHIPLQHLTGEQEFMGFSFLVNEHVLVPRQDTEILVEEALEHLKCLAEKRDTTCSERESSEPEDFYEKKSGENSRLLDRIQVLDLCTGSGCIAISLKKLCPQIEMTASDLSPEALEMARKNGCRLQAEVKWIESDLFEKLPGPYDMIVSNPPYIRRDVIETLSEEVRCHEPYQALDGHEDGLYFYRRIISEAGAHLKQGGWLCFEIGYDQGEAVSELMKMHGFSRIQVKKDLAGLDRVVSAQADVKI